MVMGMANDFAKTQQVDYHPHSKDIVRDLVHPALFSYVKGVSPVVEAKQVPPCVFTSSLEDERLTWDDQDGNA